MKKSKILQKDDPILREKAKSVPLKEIKSKQIQDVLKKMKIALHGELDGVAIAAPQIGESLRIFMVRGEILNPQKEKSADLVFINPEIIKISKTKKKMEEGCLSVRYLYGLAKRSEKVTLRAYDAEGKLSERGASGLLAQIFQHEVDHLNGILFIDKAENIHEIPLTKNVKFVFFGSSEFSQYVFDELRIMGFSPILKISSAKELLPISQLKKLDADVFVVASFGKILPKELIEMPKYKTLNVHPSLLPRLRGASPIQGTILNENEEPGVTIIQMDEKMDHGPMLAQAQINIVPWPDHYKVVEEKLGRLGGHLLGTVLSRWVAGEIQAIPQKDLMASYTKLIKKEDGLINLEDSAEINLRKVFAYSTWPGAYMFYKNKWGKEIRLVIKEAKIREEKFEPIRVVPAGKREMDWKDFLRGN